MDIGLWSLLTLVGRFLLYACVASAIGGVFSSVLLARHREVAPAITRYVGYGCLAGIVVAIYNLFIQVGGMMDRGLSGIFDANMMSVMLKTSVGNALVFELTGFAVIGVCAWWSLHRASSPRPIAPLLISVLGCLFLIASFSQVGHFAEATWVGKTAISFHILAMSLWIGSLYPLWVVSRTTDVPAIQLSMDIFGRIAAVIVFVLVACGIVMGILLVKDFHTLVSTGYGRGLLLKGLFVGALLLLAASNKWLTVPHLHRDGVGRRLSRAIILEMSLAGFIFLITGVITSVIGID